MKLRQRKHFIKRALNKCVCCGKISRESYASYLTNNSIYSEYGSNFDTMKFDVLNDSIIKNKSMLVCDTCIEQLLEKKDIVEDKSYDYFAPIVEMQKCYEENPELYFKAISASPTKCMEIIKKG